MSEEMYKKIFSKNLNYFMELNQKTQSDIVNDLNLNKSAVSTWCNGTRLPRMDKVDALAKYFNVRRSDLIEDKNNTSSEGYYLNEETRQIAQAIFDNPDLRSLFNVARDIAPDDLRAHTEFMRHMKKRERGDDEGGC